MAMEVTGSHSQQPRKRQVRRCGPGHRNKDPKPADTNFLTAAATLPRINDPPINAQDGMTPMETETVNTQKKRALSMDKTDDDTPNEHPKTMHFDFSERNDTLSGKYTHQGRAKSRNQI
eukprot:scaffold21363_cov33-Attheya_sp.AAC.1